MLFFKKKVLFYQSTIPDEGPVLENPENSMIEPAASPAPRVPVPMVEINMQNLQPTLLREELKSTSFLPKPSVVTSSKMPSQKFKSKFSFSNTSKPKTPSKIQDICRKHTLRTKPTKPRRYTYNPMENEECYRCRLRDPNSLNESVS